MAMIILDDSKVYEIVMSDEDFRRMIIKGAESVCCELEEIYEQDDYMTVAEIAKLEHDYDVVCDLREAMDKVPWDYSKNHHIDGTINVSYRRGKVRTQRLDTLEGEDDE